MDLNLNELVKIEQMPKLFEKLELIGQWVDDSLNRLDIANLEATDDNKKEIKRIKAEINSTTKELEDRRKFIKSKLLEPYEQFNKKYEEEIKSKLSNASELLKEKIDAIENEQKREKELHLIEFTNEYIKNLHLEDIISYETLNVNVTLSASEKSLKEAIKGKLESITNDLSLINLEEYKEEIYLEYKKYFDFAKSKLTVINRHQKLEELRKQQENIQESIQEEQKIEETVEEIIAPVEVEEEVPTPEINENQMMIYTFTVTGTKEQIISVRDFMKNEGIQYE